MPKPDKSEFRRGTCLMSGEEFIAAIRQSRDSDDARLSYANHLTSKGNPFGEFIRVQCELARLGEPFYDGATSFLDFKHATRMMLNGDPKINHAYRELKAREERLLALHEPNWINPLHEIIENWCQARVYRRGFVDFIELSPNDFLANAKALFQICPLLRGVSFSGDEEALRRAFSSPQLEQIEFLDLHSYFELDPQTLIALASCQHLPLLKVLRIGDAVGPDFEPISDEVLRDFAQASWMQTFEKLVLEWDINASGDSAAVEAHVNAIIGRVICQVDCCN